MLKDCSGTGEQRIRRRHPEVVADVVAAAVEHAVEERVVDVLGPHGRNLLAAKGVRRGLCEVAKVGVGDPNRATKCWRHLDQHQWQVGNKGTDPTGDAVTGDHRAAGHATAAVRWRCGPGCGPTTAMAFPKPNRGFFLCSASLAKAIR